MATSSPTGTGATAGTQIYQGSLTPLNGSGVQGSVFVVQQGSDLVVRLDATGLAPGQVHVQQIDGATAGGAASLPASAGDSNAGGFVTASDLGVYKILDLATNPQAATAGPGPQPGSLFPTADASGTLHYQETFSYGGDPQSQAALTALGSLAGREVVISGMAVPAGVDHGPGYDAAMPVAAAVLQPVDVPILG